MVPVGCPHFQRVTPGFDDEFDDDRQAPSFLNSVLTQLLHHACLAFWGHDDTHTAFGPSPATILNAPARRNKLRRLRFLPV